MDPTDPDLRLSRIATLWSLVHQAHDGDGSGVGAAQERLLERYGGAIRRYLRGALRDADAAAELFQEFAYRFLHGDLRGADQQRGRFRDYVKGVLFHLVADYHRRRQRQPRPLPPDHPEPADDEPPLAEQDRVFLASWREGLLARTWEALAAGEQASGRPYHTVLRFRAEHPTASSQEMAEQLSARLGKPLTAPGVRQLLHRAREQFADLLLDEIAQGMESPTVEQLEEELIDLGLLEHCRTALERRRPG